MLISIVSMAHAGVPVVFEGVDGTSVLAKVSERTGLPADQLDALPLDTLRGAPPGARGEAVLRRCSTAPVEADPVRADFARARAAFVDGNRFRAMDHLDLAVARIGCLSEVVDRDVAAQVFLFRGALTATADPPDLDTARGELRTAIELVRDLSFPDWLPEGAKPAFEAVHAEVDEADRGELATLTVVPANPVSGPWVDGVAVKVTADLRPGLHLFQYSSAKGIRSGWLSLGGDAEVVLPEQVRGPVLDTMAQPDGQRLVAAMLDVTVSDLSAAYVTHQGGLWLLSKTGSAIDTQVVDPPSPVDEKRAEPDDGKKKKKKKR